MFCWRNRTFTPRNKIFCNSRPPACSTQSPSTARWAVVGNRDNSLLRDQVLLAWRETISALHAKGAKAAKESAENEALSPTRVCPKQCLPKQPRQPMLSLHEPAAVPLGFGVRQSSGAFRTGPRAQKRQRTAAVQDASAPAAASSRFLVPMHAQKRKEALHEPVGNKPSPDPSQEGTRPRRAAPRLGEVGGGFMVPGLGANVVEATDESVASGVDPRIRGAKEPKQPVPVIDRPENTLQTGGAGFIGSHLVERLLEDGAK